MKGLKHKHKFKRYGNNLYCNCGKFIRMECDHKWEVHTESRIYVGINHVGQDVQTLICKKCGEIRYVNLTTG